MKQVILLVAIIAAQTFSTVHGHDHHGSPGCTDESACNYDSEATQDDGSCEYSTCGCTDISANNYLRIPSIFRIS